MTSDPTVANGQPRVSVIMPVYNPDQVLLRRALDSLLSQTLTDWQAIVIDDGSDTDIGLGWVSALDPRVAVHTQHRAGVSTARNSGISLASGEFVALLDHDDEWLPDKLTLQVQAMDADDSQAAFCYTGFDWVWPDRSKRFLYDQGVDYLQLLAGGHVCASSVLARRDAVLRAGAFNPLLKMGEDTDLWLRLTLGGARPVLVNRVLVRYHMHDDNSSRDYWSGLIDRRSVLKLHQAAARRRLVTSVPTPGGTPNTADILRSTRAGLATARHLAGSQAFDAARACRTGSRRAAVKHLSRAMLLRPGYTVASCARWMNANRPIGPPAQTTATAPRKATK